MALAIGTVGMLTLVGFAGPTIASLDECGGTWDLAPQRPRALEVQLRPDDAHRVWRLGDDRAPRAMTIEHPYAGRPGGSPICDGARTKCRVLDGSRAQEDFPVVAPGAFREVGRDGQDLRPGQGQRPVEHGITHVVIDRPTSAIDVGDGEAIAGGHPGRFGIDGAC